MSRWHLVVLSGLVLGCGSKGGDGGTGPGPGPAPTIALALGASGGTVVQGGSTTVQATVTRGGGYSGSLDFTVDGVPAGVTGSAGNVSTSGTSTSATITITAVASAAPGTYTLTLRCTGSGVAATSAAFQLTIAPAPDFSLGLGQAEQSLVQGSAGAPIAVTISRVNFGEAVTLSLGGPVPAGVTAAFSQPAPTGDTGTMTITVAAAAAPGSYDLSVIGSGAPGTRSTPFRLIITAAPNYSLSLAQAALSVAQGGVSAPIGVTIDRVNFTDPVTLSLGGPVPAGVTAAFSQPAPTGTSSTLTVTVAAAVAPGIYHLSLNGTGTPGARSTPLQLTVTVPGSFAISVGPAGPVTLYQGASDNSRTVTIARNNYGANVTLTAENLPEGVTATFSPNPSTGNTAVLTLRAADGAAVGGPFTVTIRGAGPVALKAPDSPKSAEATATVVVNVVALGSFTLGLTPTCSAPQILQGAYDDRRIVTISRTNYPVPVALSVDNLPAGLTATFVGNPVTGDSARMVLVASGSVAPGTYNLTIRGGLPAAVRAPGAASIAGTSIPFPVTVVAADAVDPNVQTFNFDSGTLEGWAPGVACAWQTAPSWGNVVAQESMFVLDGIGHRGEADAWVSRMVTIPATAALLQFDASGHFVNGADARLRIRVIDGAVATVIYDQVITGSAPVRVFTTRTASIAPWRGKTVRILFEQDANGFGGSPTVDAAEQIWLDNIRVLSAPSAQWTRRRPVTITTGSAAAPAGYSVSVQVDHAALVAAGRSLASGNDLRVAYSDGTGTWEIPRTLDPGSAWNTATTRIWFRTQAAIGANGSDGNYFLYYGNPSAGAPVDDRAEVFLYHDRFEVGNLLKWGEFPDGSWVNDNARAHEGTRSVRYGAETASARLLFAASPVQSLTDVYLEAWWYLNSASTAYKTSLNVRVQPNGDSYSLSLDESPYVFGISKTAGGVYSRLATSAVVPPVDTWVRVGIGIMGTTARIYVNGAEAATATGLTQFSAGNISLGKFEIPAGAAWWSDDVVARRFIYPEPGSAVGSEQSGPFAGGVAWLTTASRRRPSPGN